MAYRNQGNRIAIKSNQDTTGSERAFEVIVVGAGVAGIGAAIKLKQAGFEFVVLEKAAEAGGH